MPAGAKFILADVIEPAGLEPVFAQGLDAVCHIAGQVSIIRSFSDPVADLRTNVEGTLNVLKLCLKYKVPRLVYASSMTLYGDSARPFRRPRSSRAGPIPTTASPSMRPSDTSTPRRSGPDLGFDFSVTSLRMFSVYGPGQSFSNPYQGVLGIFSGNLLRGEPITIFGDGEQTRDFIYIDDIVDGWVRALNTPAAAGGVFNLGSGRSLSINELADAAIAAFGHPPGGYKVIRAPARPGEQRTVRADIGQAKAVLGWQPRTSFEAWARRHCPLGARGIRGRRRGSSRGPGQVDEDLARNLGRSLDAQRRDHPQVGRGRPRAGA